MVRCIDLKKRPDATWKTIGYLVPFAAWSRNQFFRSEEDAAARFYSYLLEPNKDRNYTNWIESKSNSFVFYSGQLMTEKLAQSYVTFATRFGLLDERLLRTYNADTLDYLIDDFQRECFDNRPLNLKRSPLELNQKQKIFFLRRIVEWDGDMILPLTKKLFERFDAEFTERQAASCYLEVLKDILEKLYNSERFSDRMLAAKLTRKHELWEKELRGEKHSTPELRVGFRLETDVALSLLAKPLSSNGRYISARGQKTVQTTPSKIYTDNLDRLFNYSQTADQLLQSFYNFSGMLYGLEAHKASDREVLKRIIAVHNIVADETQSAIKPMLMELTCIDALVDDGLTVEYEQIERVLSALYSRHGNVYTTVDQWGNELFLHMGKDFKDIASREDYALDFMKGS